MSADEYIAKALGEGRPARTDDARPIGVPHRIIPALSQIGVYRGIHDPKGRTDLTFDLLRRMAATPIIRLIVDARRRQAKMFARKPLHRNDVGFEIVPADEEESLTGAARREAAKIEELILYGGYRWQRVTDGQIARWDGRGEERAVRFDQLVGMLVEDVLVYDAACVRLETPRDPRCHPAYQANPEARAYGSPQCPVWMGPLDGSRIRRTEDTYRPPEGPMLRKPDRGLYQRYEPEIRPDLRSVAYVELDENNHVVREFPWHEVGYLARNICSDQWTTGYGRSPLEYLIEVVIGLIGGMGYNVEFFSHNHIPSGILSLTGEYTRDYLEEFRTTLMTQVGGPGKFHRLPILFTTDANAAAQFLNLRDSQRVDMYWERWITWLVSVACAMFGMSPEEVNFQSFRGAGNALQEADPATRITQGHDQGFVPLMLDLAQFITEIIQRIDERFVFRWRNLHRLDERAELELVERKMDRGLLTVNQARMELNYEPIRDPLDRDLWRRIENEVKCKWPALKSDRSERERVTRQLYEHFGGKFALWPDVPGIPHLVAQIYVQEMQQVLMGANPMGMGDMMGIGGLPEGGLPEEGLEDAGGGAPGPLGMGSPEQDGEAGMGAGAGAPPAPPQDELLAAFMPPMPDGEAA
ncbi:MAG: hypothetical protein AB7Y46_08080 [Armatimonadota bacterium]